MMEAINRLSHGLGQLKLNAEQRSDSYDIGYIEAMQEDVVVVMAQLPAKDVADGVSLGIGGAEYCYSWNGEDFNSGTFDSVNEALAEAAVESEGEHTLVHVGEVSRPDNSMFFPDAADVIEHMAEQADDYGGEHAFDYPDVSDEARAELTEQLETLLNDWCEKHGVAPTFYQVADIKEYPLPAADDIQEIKTGEAS